MLPPLADIDSLAILTDRDKTDPGLKLALERASSRFRLEVEHSVTLTNDDQITLDGNGGAALLLPAAPVVEITVMMGGRLLTETTHYSVNRKNGILYRKFGERWPRGYGNIAVTYSHGYENVPEGISDAVLEHAETLAETKAYVSQESATSVQISYGVQAMVGRTQKWSEAVAKYRLDGRV